MRPSCVQFKMLDKTFKISPVRYQGSASDGTGLFYAYTSFNSSDIKFVFVDNVNKWIDVEMEYA